MTGKQQQKAKSTKRVGIIFPPKKQAMLSLSRPSVLTESMAYLPGSFTHTLPFKIQQKPCRLSKGSVDVCFPGKDQELKARLPSYSPAAQDTPPWMTLVHTKPETQTLFWRFFWPQKPKMNISTKRDGVGLTQKPASTFHSTRAVSLAGGCQH